MSHVVAIDLSIQDLEALGKSADRNGMELRRGQKTHRWYGTHVGDYPMPEGFTKSDLGHCDHAIAVKGDPTAYEIGVVKRRDGKKGYTLLFDFWGSHGAALENKAGQKCSKLIQDYTAEVVSKKAIGWEKRQIREKNGKLKIVLTR